MDTAIRSRQRRRFWSGCRRVALGALRESSTDRVALAGAGCGFYATMISGWLGLRDTHELLNGDFTPFEMFSQKA